MADGTRTVAAFDLDGTLTRRDTLLPFLAALCGRVALAKAVIAVSGVLATTMLADDNARRGEVKDQLLAKLVAGRPLAEVQLIAQRYAHDDRRLEPAAAEHLRALGAPPRRGPRTRHRLGVPRGLRQPAGAHPRRHGRFGHPPRGRRRPAADRAHRRRQLPWRREGPPARSVAGGDRGRRRMSRCSPTVTAQVTTLSWGAPTIRRR